MEHSIPDSAFNRSSLLVTCSSLTIN